ncbi:MAG: recombination regulator RecX [Gemmatimonadota bacterium]|nr:recombination regulator RecX [Gemmatimonadota bacterium]
MRYKGVSRGGSAFPSGQAPNLEARLDVYLNKSASDTYVITGIVAAPRHAGRFDIMINGEDFAALSLDVIERLEIAVGVDITVRLPAVLAEAAQLAVYDRALNMLAFRARSSSELARALKRKGADPVHVSAAVSRLVEQGFIDDAAFARAYTRSKVVGANHSKRRVQMDLRRKGVAGDVSEGAIADVFEEEGVDQLALVETAARKKLRTLHTLEPAVQRRRLYGFLARRGYDADDIRRAMEIIGGESAE